MNKDHSKPPSFVVAATVILGISWAWRAIEGFVTFKYLPGFLVICGLLLFLLQGLYRGKPLAFWSIVPATALLLLRFPGHLERLETSTYQRSFICHATLEAIALVCLLTPKSLRWYFRRTPSNGSA